MKDNKKIKIILIVCGCVLVLALISFFMFKIITKLENNRKDKLAREKEIIANFDSFKDNAFGFSDESIDYRSWIKDSINKDTIYQYDTWVFALDTMKEYLDAMTEVAPMYKENCIDRTYTNTKVNQQCSSFIEAYEEAVNTYVTDVNDFNEKMKDLREKTKNEDLKDYELTYEKIDLNNDKEYSEIVIEGND